MYFDCNASHFANQLYFQQTKFYYMKRLLKIIFYIIVIFTAFSFISCKSYYKIVTVPVNNNAEKAAKIDSLKNKQRDFIIRNGSSAFYANTLSVNANENSMECTLEKLNASNILYVTRGINGRKTYHAVDPTVLNEVHIYTNPDGSIVLGSNKIYLEKIQKIEIIEKDKRRTTASHVFGAMIITGSILLLIVTITFLSNPFSLF